MLRRLLLRAPMVAALWARVKWRIRGLQDLDDWFALCARCGRKGMEHWNWRGCLRFKRGRKPLAN